MKLTRKNFDIRAGNGHVEGSITIAQNGHIRINTETEARNDAVGWKGAVWADIYNGDGNHVFTTDFVSVYANARIWIYESLTTESKSDQIPKEIMEIIKDPRIEIIVVDREDFMRNWKDSVSNAKEILKDVYGLADASKLF